MRKGPPVPPPKGRKATDGDVGERADVADSGPIEDVEGEKAYEEEVVVRRGRFGPTIERARTAYGYIKRYERALAAFSMVAGFITDNLMFRRIDLPNTQALFAAYLAVAASSILGLHFLERRAREGRGYARWRALFPMATQFALGSLWSAFLVFYSRSAVVTKSWPYLAVLTAFFIGNEVLKRYHSRLVFTTTLFFFAVFSCAIVTVPIYTHTIGRLTFLLSGAVAVGVLVLFLYLLAAINRTQYVAARGKIALGAAGVYVLMNVFYFTNTLPPLPLALSRVGIYHMVKKTGDVYEAVGEAAPWYTEFGYPPTLHVTAGQPLYAYSAVFAPTKLSIKIVHRWRRYDPKSGHWLTVSSVTFPINGGRDGGYRGYTIKHNVQPGDWRVDIDTVDNHLIGRVTFKVERADAPSPGTPQVLK